MRAELIRLLLEQPHDDYISGQAISEYLSCSRTAVWKQINLLKEHGFTIESSRNRGYKLTGEPEHVYPDAVLARLQKGNSYFKSIHKVDETTSTQDDALKLIQEGAESGTVTVSDMQSAGRGRLGRSWDSPRKGGLWFSMILKPDIPVHKAPQLTLLTGVALAQTVNNQLHGQVAAIKWPNDLLINHKKIAGILTEMHADPDKVKALIIGVGLNVNQEMFPDWLLDIADSLGRMTGARYNLNEILSDFLIRFDELYHLFIKEGFLPIRNLWKELALSPGQTVHYKHNKGVINGTTHDIDEEGVMQIKDDQGTIHRVFSSELSWRNEA
ncbi:biotin--[acetyl-CoA-carboxylase] ligase [Salisediminibacterium selenitireducens]|uniref:Bifunctional ligase/repressor BirA n=1 Tax=Bacillus selenitireducens (strain ATCC 700615 / DSM 15326 / MLS10) TaxID=439292 RepID=D6XUX1_BACIE|nr:biotin--[acetyl-CoA-carboxylase] ligase [Salisediminibacterium selenitireducens]ADH99607.1 biotin/acetyl-CoA-carboxylase ligase [[Bacillus] selenitireducens MLS10]